MAQPQSNTSIKYGQAVILSVSATGAENLVYQWKKNGQDLTNDRYIGTNTPTLTISKFLPDDQGRYVCGIKNCNSTIESAQADLELGMFISIALKIRINNIIQYIKDFQVYEHPKSMSCDYHAPVSLTVSAIGPGPLTYQWRREGAVIDDEDCTGVYESTLTIRLFSLKHEGYYSCEVKCNENSVESDPAKLELSK